jgi:hypothetical protein
MRQRPAPGQADLFGDADGTDQPAEGYPRDAWQPRSGDLERYFEASAAEMALGLSRPEDWPVIGAEALQHFRRQTPEEAGP